MDDRIPDFDLYAELEVSERASAETIQAAFRSLQMRNHPDRAGPGAADRSVRLNVAREWLTDDARRARYDAHLSQGRRPPATAGDAGSDADGEGQEGDGRWEAPRPGLFGLARRHLRVDGRRLARVWGTALALLGAVALVPGRAAAPWLGWAVAAAIVLALLGLSLGWPGRDPGAGLLARLAGWLAAALGRLLLGCLAAVGAAALLGLASGGWAGAATAELALPVLAVATLLSPLTLRRRARDVGLTVDEFLAMTPREFEQAVGAVLGRHGYLLELTGGPGDLAADLAGLDPDGLPTVVQCKRFAPGHPVGSRDVQLLIAMGMRHHGAERLVLVTTSDFTDPARDLAGEHGVDLIAGGDLEGLAR